ncbi:MAG: hypothetical protein GVY13_05445 [Alphaproteobacteria bacterium]|jgi:polysaccharide chain length determinant protein (PEP-CTERM system associated)|nr:hypothetical protein [Alphaproteobacteria bacterium]
MIQEVIMQVLGYAAAAWRRRWYGLLVAWVVCLGGWYVVEKIPDNYSASTRVYIDTQSLIRPLMRGLAADMDANMMAELELVRRTLLSRPNIREIMRMTDLDVRASTPAAQERLAAELASRIRVETSERDNIFAISYEDSDPRQAFEVVRAVLDLFVETNLGANREDLQATQRFLDQQIREEERRLDGRETVLAEFRVANRGFLPGPNSYEVQLQAAEADLDRLELALEEAREERDSLTIDLARLQESLAAGAQAGSPQSQRVAELRSYLDELLMRYTPEHPEVVLTERLLEREQQRLRGAPDGSGGATTPMIEQVRSMLNRQESAIASYEQRIDALNSTIAELTALLEQAPEVRSEFTRLQRQVETVRNNYQSLVDRREQARFAEVVDTQTDAVEFRIVEPPVEPVIPSGPSRLILRSAVLVLGLGAGGAFAVLLGITSGTFSTAKRLEMIADRPVLGCVTRVRMPRDRRRHAVELAGFAVLVLGLFGVFAGMAMGVANGPMTMS